MMHIAFLDSIEKETYGGMEEWIGLVAGGLIQRGHMVSLMGRRGSRFLERVGGNVASAEVVPLEISGDFDPLTIARIKRHLSDRNVDIISVNFNKDVRLGGIAARWCGSVKVVWSVGIDVTRNNLIHRLLTPRLVDRVIVPSHALKGEITRHGYIDPDVVEVIPIGIPQSDSALSPAETRKRLRQKYGIPENATVAVTSARFVIKKGHEFLIEAAPSILARHPDVYFLFLGDGPMETNHRQRIEELGLRERFIFAGMLQDMDLQLRGGDLMIHPSKEEPFGIVLLEGMRAGLPIAASRVGGIPEVVKEGETAVLFEPCRPEAISEAVVGLLDNRENMKRMGERGQIRCADNFSLPGMVDRVERLLVSMVPLPGQGRKSGVTGGQSEATDKSLQEA